MVAIATLPFGIVKNGSFITRRVLSVLINFDKHTSQFFQNSE